MRSYSASWYPSDSWGQTGAKGIAPDHDPRLHYARLKPKACFKPCYIHHPEVDRIGLYKDYVVVHSKIKFHLLKDGCIYIRLKMV